MCRYCEEGDVLKSSDSPIELFDGRQAALMLALTKNKNGDPVIRAKIIPNADHPNYLRGNVDRTPTCAIKIKYCPLCGNKLVKDPIFPELTSESAAEIFRDPANGPAIKFWIKVEGRYLAVDNQKNIYTAKDFATKEECLDWLARR